MENGYAGTAPRRAQHGAAHTHEMNTRYKKVRFATIQRDTDMETDGKAQTHCIQRHTHTQRGAAHTHGMGQALLRRDDTDGHTVQLRSHTSSLSRLLHFFASQHVCKSTSSTTIDTPASAVSA